jgi:DNA-binding MarR family transcriptional regulator
MRIEDEIKSGSFKNPIHRTFLNAIFSGSWARTQLSLHLKPFKLTYEQFHVMKIVRETHPAGVRVKEITIRMPDANSNTTRIIDKLLLKKLALRQPTEKDGRERAIFLTPAGVDLLNRIEAAWEKSSPYATSLTVKEAAQLDELLEKLRTV